MSKILLVYANNSTSLAVKKAVGRKGEIVKIENLSHLHKSCRTIPADALFIGEAEWDVFGCTALHPDIAPHIHFPIILVTENLSAPLKKREMIFRFVSVPEEQKSQTESVGYQAALRPFLRFFTPLAVGARVRISGSELPHLAGKGDKEKAEREKKIEAIRELCGHKKCRDVFDLILSCGEKGASSDFIQFKLWPQSDKSRRGDIQSYVCKIRKAMRTIPDCHGAITCEGGKYFFVWENNK